VIPFDPGALLAILLTFYPTVSVSELQRARRERPEYFAGGELTGSKGEKLVLADGRCFDLIYALGDPFADHRWQVVECGDGGAGGADWFPLEPGPLRLIDGSAWPAPAPAPFFEPLVSGALEHLPLLENGVAGAELTIAESSSPATFENDYHRTLGGIEGVIVGSRYMLEGVNAGELLDQAGGLENSIDGNENEYFEPDPADMPATGDPGGAPPDVPDRPPASPRNGRNYPISRSAAKPAARL
jgi:hypothetical protein